MFRAASRIRFKVEKMLMNIDDIVKTVLNALDYRKLLLEYVNENTFQKNAWEDNHATIKTPNSKKWYDFYNHSYKTLDLIKWKIDV